MKCTTMLLLLCVLNVHATSIPVNSLLSGNGSFRKPFLFPPISGVVKDASGAPVSSATITIKGSSRATSTDEAGKFTIDVKPGEVLVISHIGFQKQEAKVGSAKSIDIVLTATDTGLDDVVVIGYGTAKRRDLTGTVGSVSAREIMQSPVASVSEALTGKVAGLQVAATEGSPDAEVKIRLRGGGSITGDNTPLFIVDGFPVASISDISPSDIASIDILKDASSTAIYGSRGANGVIIVTTKTPKSGKISLTYNAYGGYRKLAKKLDVLPPADYAKWQYELSLLMNSPDNYTKYFGNYQDIDLYQQVKPNDWQDLVFGRQGSVFNHNLGISGGTDKTKYSVTYNHINDKAIMQLSGFKRDNVTMRINTKPLKTVTLDFSLRYANTEIKGGGANEQKEVSSADSRLKYAMIYPPFPVGGLTNSTETDDEFNLYNPLVALSDNDRFQERTNYTMNGSVNWQISDDLTFRSEFGIDYINYDDNRYYGKTTYYVNNIPAALNQGHPALTLYKETKKGFRTANTLNYNFKKLMPDGHSLTLLGGQEYQTAQSQYLRSTVHGFPLSFSFKDATNLSAQGVANSIENYYSPDNNIVSFFGRINYDYKGKYLLNATYRADGSSKFAKGNQWGYFPSVAAAWRISAEPFMVGTSKWLTDLKLRASYGESGNNNIPSGQTVQTFDVSTTTWVNGFNSYWAASKVMANPDLQWETTITKNIGLDFTLLGGKLNGNVDLYENKTKDLLILFPTPGSGYDGQYRNLGTTKNKGLEVTARWNVIDTKKFGLTIGANIGFNSNKIESLGGLLNYTDQSNWASTEIGSDYLVETGYAVGRMIGYQNDGRYEVSDFTGYNSATGKWVLKPDVADASAIVGTLRPGSMKLKNLNNKTDNIVNAADRVVIGNANPKHTGGFNLNGKVMNFDIAAIFNWSYGNDVYNANKIEYTSTSKYHSRNMISEMAEGSRWNNLLPDGTISNDPAQLAALNANTTMWSPYMSRYVFSDWAVEDGSFLRLNTLTVGYTLPSSLGKKAKLQNCRFYVTAYNVFIITNYTGFDPEVSTRRRTNTTPGVDYSAYPRSRLAVVGLNLNF